MSTGRKCEGYQVWVPRAQRLRLGPSTLPGVGSPDLRSLDFFRQIVAPRLAMPVSRCFWTHVLPQVTQQEPAIRHAIVALSSLYENFLKDSISVPASQRKFPAAHYNAAIKQITTPQLVPIHMDVVVMACLLFMSIDLFSGNIKGAIDHFRHGQKLVSTYKTTPHMAGIFRQLHIFSLFISELSHLQAAFIPQKSELIMEPFESITEAKKALDSFIHRSLHVLSAMDYASSIPRSRAKNQIRSMQRALNEDMDIWILRLQQLTKYEAVRKPNEVAYIFKLEMRWHVCKIWINFGPSGEEHTIQYTSARRIFEILSMLYGTDGTTTLPFEVDTGLPPILHLIFMNSPNLDFRLASLDLFRDKYWWEKNIPACQAIYAAGKQAIQKDFGLVLGPEWLDIETSPRMQHLRVPMFSRFQSLCSWTVVLADISEQIQKLELKPIDQSSLAICPPGCDTFSLLT